MLETGEVQQEAHSKPRKSRLQLNPPGETSFSQKPPGTPQTSEAGANPPGHSSSLEVLKARLDGAWSSLA